MNKYLVVLVVLALTVGVAPPLSADVQVTNMMRGDVGPGLDGTRVYAYGSGVDHRFDDAADFAGGTYGGRAVAAAGSVGLADEDADWWNSDWPFRHCLDVVATDPVSQYPFRVEVDTELGTVDDVRVVEHVSPTASSAVPVPHLVESGIGTASTVIWFRGTADPVGRRYCVYFGSGESSTSDESAPFVFDNGQTISYYTMLDTYRGAGAQSEVDVISYVDNNRVSDGTTTVVLDTGEIATFTRLDEQSVITATGPIDAGSDKASKEALVPESFADSRFAFPTRRYTERFWVRSPHATTTIEAVSDGAVLTTTVVTPAMGAVEIIAAGVGDDYVSLRSSDGTDFLAAHAGTNDQDIFLGVPWFGDDLVGVASNNINFGALEPTSVSWVRTGGATNAGQAVPVDTMAVIGGNGAYGNGRSYVVSGDEYFAAVQQADNDGTEVTSFLPTRLLATTYRLPTAARYFAVACPTPGTTVEVDGAAIVDCNDVGVGHHAMVRGDYPAGTLITADKPIFVYYETARDERSLFSAKASLPYLADHKYALDPVETFKPCGTWTSPSVPMSGVPGLLDIDVDLDPGGSATYHLAFDGGPFVGPDGTANTGYSSGDVVPYGYDGATAVVLKVTLCGPGSELHAVGLEDQLVELIGGPSAPVGVGPITADGAILRVYPTLDNVRLRLVSAAAPADYEVTVDVGGLQVLATSGTVTNPGSSFASQPFSVAVEGLTPQVGSLDIDLVDEGSVRVDTAIRLNFVV